VAATWVAGSGVRSRADPAAGLGLVMSAASGVTSAPTSGVFPQAESGARLWQSIPATLETPLLLLAHTRPRWEPGSICATEGITAWVTTVATAFSSAMSHMTVTHTGIAHVPPCHDVHWGGPAPTGAIRPEAEESCETIVIDIGKAPGCYPKKITC
jgi:hypothetical protein